jgi:hypothetical protein
VYFFAGRAKSAPETYTQKMKRKIDSVFGRFVYSGGLPPPSRYSLILQTRSGLIASRCAANAR